MVQPLEAQSIFEANDRLPGTHFQRGGWPQFAAFTTNGIRSPSADGERPVRTQSIFGVGLRTREHGAFDDTGRFELPQLFGQDFLSGSRDAAFEFLKAQCTLLERIQYEGFPFPTDNVDGGFDGTIFKSHAAPFQSASHKKVPSWLLLAGMSLF
jgi:hypothetical protein